MSCIEDSFGLYHAGLCYTYHHKSSSWFEAESDCRNKGSQLAMLKNKSTVRSIKLFKEKKKYSFPYYWIGMMNSKWQTDSLSKISPFLVHIMYIMNL